MRRANFLPIVLFLSAGSLFATDVKVRTRKHVVVKGGPSSNTSWQEQMLYVQGMAQRKEFARYTDASQLPQEPPTPHVAVISHCDTGVGYEIDFDNHEYREFKVPKYPSQHDVEKEMAEAKKEAEKSKQNTTMDTGETRDFHGHTARHLITTIKVQSRFNPYIETLDGWYLDIPKPGCAPEYIRRNMEYDTVVPLIFVGSSPGHSEYSVGPSPTLNLLPRGMAVMHVRSSLVPAGLPVEQNTTHRSSPGSGDGKQVVIETQVVDFSEAPLDPALFEVPPGFKKVSELYKHKPTKY